jgi:hypothetical protein
VLPLLKAAIWRCFSGCDPGDALGTRARVPTLPPRATSPCCSGSVPPAARGTRRPAARQQPTATWRCSSGWRVATPQPDSTMVHVGESPPWQNSQGEQWAAALGLHWSLQLLEGCSPMKNQIQRIVLPMRAMATPMMRQETPAELDVAENLRLRRRISWEMPFGSHTRVARKGLILRVFAGS